MTQRDLQSPGTGIVELTPGTDVTITGMVQSLRRMAWGGFLLLRTGRSLIQVVLDASIPGVPIDSIHPEATVRVIGLVKEAKITDRAVTPSNAEVQASAVTVISSPDIHEFPVDITKKELTTGLSTLFDHRPLTLRHPKQRALFRVQAAVQNAFVATLSSLGFTRIASPKLVASGAEGGANIFELDYFGTPAYLAQSPQFYKQMMVAVFDRVFETAPVFRAEKHNTSRHLNEYISLDFEMRLTDSYEEIMQVEAAVLNGIFDAVRTSCEHEVRLLEIEVPAPVESLTIVPFDEAVELVYQDAGVDVRGEPDLSPEAEAALSAYAKREWGADFVFVSEFPSSKRPFYTMDCPDNPERTNSFDLLFRGVEITTGGQRLHRYADYVEKMTGLGMDPAQFQSYLQAFSFGMPPHGGLGFGLERFTAKLCGIENVKALSLFPRDLNRLEP